jgi:hypothetical protein
MKYYCPNNDKIYDEDDLIPIWSKNGKHEDLGCPGCGEFEHLEEIRENDDSNISQLFIINIYHYLFSKILEDII